MCVASAIWPAVSLRPKRGGAGRLGRRLTFTFLFSPFTYTIVIGDGAAFIALLAKPSLSAGHSSSPKKEEV